MCTPWFFDGTVLHSLAGMDVMVNTVKETDIPAPALPVGATHVLSAWGANGDSVFPLYAGTKEACQIAFTLFFAAINTDEKIINHANFADAVRNILQVVDALAADNNVKP